MSHGNVVAIPISAIRPDPGQPREEKPANEISTMSKAFEINGFPLDASITVRPDPECDAKIGFKNITQDNVDKHVKAGGKFMIVKGECRYTTFVINDALREKYNGAITCFIDLQERDAKTIFLDQSAENVNRIQMSPMNSVRAYGRAVELGATIDEVAETFGRQPGFIQSELDLLRLPRFIQNEVDKGSLPKTVAHEIAKEPTDARMGAAYKQAAKGNGAKGMLVKLQAWKDQDAQKTLDAVFGTQDAPPDELKKAGKAYDKLVKAVNAFADNAGNKGALIIKARSKNITKVENLGAEMVRQGQMIIENAKLYRAYTGIEEKKAS